MIDINKETLIRISEVPRRLPPSRSGKPVHISAVYRWMQRGRNGVRLRWIRLGGSRFTSLEALQEYADACTATDASPPSPQGPTPARRARQIEAATRRVEEILRGNRNSS